MTIRKRISGETIKRNRTFARVLKPSKRKIKSKTLLEYLERLPVASPEARMLFSEMVRDYVLPYRRKFLFSGYPVTIYPVYRNDSYIDSSLIRIYSVDVGFCVREKSAAVVCRLGNDKARWTRDLTVAVIGLQDNGYTPKDKKASGAY